MKALAVIFVGLAIGAAGMWFYLGNPGPADDGAPGAAAEANPQAPVSGDVTATAPQPAQSVPNQAQDQAQNGQSANQPADPPSGQTGNVQPVRQPTGGNRPAAPPVEPLPPGSTFDDCVIDGRYSQTYCVEIFTNAPQAGEILDDGLEIQ